MHLTSLMCKVYFDIVYMVNRLHIGVIADQLNLKQGFLIDINSGSELLVFPLKCILFVAQVVVSVEVIDNYLVDDNLKDFAENSKEPDRVILLR